MKSFHKMINKSFQGCSLIYTGLTKELGRSWFFIDTKVLQCYFCKGWTILLQQWSWVKLRLSFFTVQIESSLIHLKEWRNGMKSLNTLRQNWMHSTCDKEWTWTNIAPFCHDCKIYYYIHLKLLALYYFMIFLYFT